MNSTPTVAAWLQLGGVLAAQVALLVMLAAVLERFTKSGLWRRTLWQACVVSSVLLLLGELGGLQRGVNRWIRVATTSPVAPPPLTSPMPPQPLAELTIVTEAVSLVVPPAMQIPEPTLRERSTWWPAMVWLGGFVLLAVRGALARFFFFFFRRRRQRALNDPVLLERLHAMAGRLGVQHRVNVTETTGLSGPITYGIVRPCISLPENFSADFTQAKQEVMLAHELAHLAARDPLWHALAELVAALLWWHPLIWWARQRLRIASEAAADEASLVVENGPVVLAECLVELGGRLTRTRPLGWLGIEGINFRSGLGQRVKRLVGLNGGAWRPLQRTSAWFITTAAPFTLVFAVFAGTAWTQPRDESPGGLQDAFQQSFIGLALAVVLQSDRAPKVGESASVASAADKALLESSSVAEADAKPTAVPELNSGINDKGIQLAQAEPRRDRPGEEPHNPPAEKSTSLLTAAGAEPAVSKPVSLVDPSRGTDRRKAINQKLDSILLDELALGRLTLSQAIERLAAEAKARDPEKRGVNFIIGDSLTSVIVQIQPPLKNIILRQALDVLCRDAAIPLRYNIEDYAVIITAGAEAERPPLYTRWFKVDLNTLASWVRHTVDLKARPGERPAIVAGGTGGVATNGLDSVVEQLRQLLARAGADLSPLEKQLTYNDRLGMLMVRATVQDLDIVEQTIQVLNTPQPQVSIEVKFCEITEEDMQKLGFDWFLHRVNSNSGPGIERGSWAAPAPAATTGILTEPQSRVVLRALEQRRGVNILSTPKVITLSGRQAQIKTVEVRYIVTDLNYGTNTVAEGGKMPPPQYNTEAFELGPVIDVVPYVLTDGVTISMTVIPTVKEFVGYDLDTAERLKNNYNSGDPKSRPTAPMNELVPLPIFKLRQIVASANIWDGQTLVLVGGSMKSDQKSQAPAKEAAEQKGASKLFHQNPASSKKKSLLVFVTPTIIDAAGNRVHPADTFPIRQDSVPPQKPGAPPSK